MDPRRNLSYNALLQLVLVLGIAVMANVLAARHFGRLDLTADHRYSLDLVTRNLMSRLERPLIARVYFTRGLDAPYNNYEQILTDKLEDLRAYSKGWMDIQVSDPTDRPEVQEEAAGYGINTLPLVYSGASGRGVKQVYMGLVLVYGSRQEVIPAVAQTETLEYELARAVKSLVATEDRKMIAFSAGSGEPDLRTATGPLQGLVRDLTQRYGVAQVTLGGPGLLPEEVDALLIVAPQKPMSARALYQVDQLLMRGGSLAIFAGNVRPDLRALRPQSVPHGLDELLGNLGVLLNRDIIIDRVQNGRYPFPIQQGQSVVRQNINYPLLPKATMLNRSTALTKGVESLLFPFASTLALRDPLPEGVTADVIASTSPDAGRVKGLRSIDPFVFQNKLSSEETGSFPLLVTLSGRWPSLFADGDVPAAAPGAPTDPSMTPDDPGSRLREGQPSRVAVAGSADFVGNNQAFMLNLVDWMLQDESLVAIRAKDLRLPELKKQSEAEALRFKLVNLLTGPGVLLAFGALRWFSRRPKPDQGGAA